MHAMHFKVKIIIACVITVAICKQGHNIFYKFMRRSSSALCLYCVYCNARDSHGRLVASETLCRHQSSAWFVSLKTKYLKQPRAYSTYLTTRKIHASRATRAGTVNHAGVAFEEESEVVGPHAFMKMQYGV